VFNEKGANEKKVLFSVKPWLRYVAKGRAVFFKGNLRLVLDIVETFVFCT